MKKAIILGATSGIGKGFAKLLIENGYKVGATGRRTELLEKLKNENQDFIIKAFDITDTQTTIEKLTELTTKLGGLDLLVISSGTGDENDNLDFDIEKRAINTNVIGFTNVACWAFNFFKNQKAGHLVGITSVAGIRGSRQGQAYNATKAYQISYLEALRQKASFIKLPVIVTDIRPGFVDTEMAKGDGLFWVSTVDKAAKQIFDAIKSKKKVAYISKRWLIIGTLLKIIPKWIYDKM